MDATVQGGESQTDGLPWDWDLEAIAVAAAAAGATAYCASVGLGPAAPLCGTVAAEVTEWAMDNVVGPFVNAIGGLFEPAPLPPSLITGMDPCDIGPDLTGMIADWYVPKLYVAINAHRDLGLPGVYQFREAMWSMAMRGLALPMRRDFMSDFGEDIPSAPFPPNFSAEYAFYKTSRLAQLTNAVVNVTTTRYASGRPITETVSRGMTLSEKCDLIYGEFHDDTIIPWMDSMEVKLAAEVANLVEVAIALEVMHTASRQTPPSPYVEFLAMGDPSALASLALTVQQSLEAQKAAPPAPAKKSRTWLYVAGAGVVVAGGALLWSRKKAA
jgi:hypothetical protein